MHSYNYSKFWPTYLIRGAVNVCLMSPGAQSPGLGCPFRKASACSGSRADRDLSRALNSFRLGLSGSLRRGELNGRPASGQTRPGADREHDSEEPCDSPLSGTSLFGNAKYDGLSEKKITFVNKQHYLSDLYPIWYNEEK